MKEIDKQLDVFLSDKTIVYERQKEYFKKALIIYPTKEIELSEYNQIRKDFYNGDQSAIKRLIEKSIYSVLLSASKVYAQYDIEKYISFEEGISIILEKFNQYALNFKELPKYRGQFTYSLINYYVFKEIRKHYVRAKSYYDKVEIMPIKDIAWIFDHAESEEISFKSLNFDEMKSKLSHFFDLLDDRQRKIISLKFGFETGEELTYEEVSNICGLTRSRVEQIVKSAFRKILKKKKVNQLKQYADLDLEL